MLTGVCAGLGRYAGMDPVLFRVGFAVLVIGSGIGIFLYLAAFLLMRGSNGGPGYFEQWTRRAFDAQTVLALLASVFAFGLIINLASGGISAGTIAVATLLAIALLTAHIRGVDLLSLVKNLPDHLMARRGHLGEPAAGFERPPASPAHPAYPTPPTGAPGSVPEPPQGPPQEPDDYDARVTSRLATPPSTPSSASAPKTPAPETPVRSGDGYARLADLARKARASSGVYGSGEPFAPHGPYDRFRTDQSKTYDSRTYDADPYLDRPGDLAEHQPIRTAAPRRRRSFIGLLTTCLALIIGGTMVAAQPGATTSANLTLAGGAVLVTIGAGLLVATWFGRGAGLVAAGTIVCLALVAGTTFDSISARIGSYTWTPVDATTATADYSVGIGDGTLNLSDTSVEPGSRTRFDASIMLGELKVIVPRTARVEIFADTRFGDIRIEHSMHSGPGIHVTKTLPADVTGESPAPTLELHLKAGLGDVEVRRAA